MNSESGDHDMVLALPLACLRTLDVLPELSGPQVPFVKWEDWSMISHLPITACSMIRKSWLHKGLISEWKSEDSLQIDSLFIQVWGYMQVLWQEERSGLFVPFLITKILVFLITLRALPALYPRRTEWGSRIMRSPCFTALLNLPFLIQETSFPKEKNENLSASHPW
jgi:hypothetical protein